MELLYLAVVTASNLLCFVIGARVGQKVTKGEEIKMPSVNPIQAYREYEAKMEAEHEQSKIDTIMENLERYDGTSNGQMDVPR